MHFKKRFIHTLNTDFPAIYPSKTILLAVSGGVDSMVLLHLFQSLPQFSIAVAHCNYKLRAESDTDATFIKSHCQKKEIPYFEKVFETIEESNKAKTGIQETARKLRYSFFNEVCATNQFCYIATAHHQNDSAETILFNLTRGSGSKGIQGIPPITNNILRPLINFSKTDIQSYAQLNKIDFREDSSNRKNDYSRNKIRNMVIPILNEINPQVLNHITQLGKQISLMDKYINDQLSKSNVEVIQSFESHREINLSSHKASEFLSLYINHFIGHHDLSFSQIQNLIEAYRCGKSGVRFLGKQNIYIVSRDVIIIQQTLDPIDNINIQIEELLNQIIQTQVGTIHISTSKEIPPTFEEGKLYFDTSKIKLPITIRRWKSGDTFSPLGLNGNKTVSDFLTNKKINSFQKSSTLIIEDCTGILIGLVGFQVHNNYKVDTNSSSVTCLSLN